MTEKRKEKDPHPSQKSEGLRHPKIQSQRLRHPPGQLVLAFSCDDAVDLLDYALLLLGELVNGG
jgi:hypothetical protein